MKLSSQLVLFAIVALLPGCEPIDTSALKEIEDTVSGARQTVETANARGVQVQQVLVDPAGALRAAASVAFAKTATDQPGVFLLTDLSTGCQFLATYDADGRTVASITPRTRLGPDGDAKQVCIGAGGNVQAAVK